jgi:hypothetical protein
VKSLLFEICSNCGIKIEDEERALVLDPHNEVIFCGEACLKENFESEIDRLQREHLARRSDKDIPPAHFSKYQSYLELVLTEPDEVWEQATDEDAPPVSFFIGEYLHEEAPVFYIAGAYYAEEKPAFVYIHFPTNDVELVQIYRSGTLVYDGLENQSDEIFEISEDSEAFELYREMIDHRSDTDVDLDEFSHFDELKLKTVDKPDEIWKRIDDSGNTFIIFIAHFTREQEPVAYVVVTMDDEISDTTIPLFGFPTTDQKLLDRFRVGEKVLTEGDEF